MKLPTAWRPTVFMGEFMSSQVDLQCPIKDGGIRVTNFFNGRLLTGADMSREQTAQREIMLRLGTAVGEGVIYGLEVTKTPNSTNTRPAVTVKAGVAINRNGQTLTLTSDVEVSLIKQTTSSASAGTSGFGECQPLEEGMYIADPGVYLLSISSAQTTEGRATVSGLGNTLASCNTDTKIVSVQFRLQTLNLTTSDLNPPSHLRNRVAYKCFGVSDQRTSAFLKNPFGPSLTNYGLLDDLRPNQLTNDDVPLAVINWTPADGIRFIDLWSVRRYLARPTPSSNWAWFVGERRLREAEAMFLQFQEQVKEMRETESNLHTIEAMTRFDYLPPVGILPLTGVGGAQGFNYQKFFADQEYHPPVLIEGASIDYLIRASLMYAPISLQNKDPLRLYQITEGTTQRSYMIFVSAFVPFPEDTRFSTVRWDYSNFV